MKALSKHFIIALLASAASLTAFAQQSSSSSVVRRGDRTRPGQEDASPAVTGRMQQHFGDASSVSDADMQWMRVIYRQIDLDKGGNASLYYPEEIIDGQENLFRIIMRLLAENRIQAYEYLDGREVFTDQYRIKVREMLDRFQILYTEAKGSTEKNPRFTIEESDVPANEVLSYYIIERWTFDRRSNAMKTVVEAICPVLHRSGDFGGEAVKYPMFWIKLDVLRPYLTTQYIFTDDDNNLARYTYDDFFTLGMYEGDIYKTRNLRNRSMAQLYNDPDDLKRAQDSIQRRLETYDDNLWVPSREEIIAAREAREAAAAASDSTAIAARPVKEGKTAAARSTRSARAKKKSPKVSNSAPKTTSSSAARSVRRRKN
ncbi:MAG: gliding motility protein GldN [Muribaculaceae bacterium]|nr:gliding motility protein GldN [Muribaculaceae bacterium]